MKPTLGRMDEKSQNVAVVLQQPEKAETTSKKSNKRLIIGVVGVVVVGIIILAAIIVAVLLGAKIAREAQKDAWLNFQDKNGEQKSEHVVANNREEDYTVPNKMRVIFDFDKGYAIYKLERSKGDDDDDDNDNYDICYVSHLNRTDLASPQELKDAMNNDEIDKLSDDESEDLKYESTGQMFDRDLLSPRAREMCKNSKVVWMAKVTDETREKRARYRCYRYRRCYSYLVRIRGRLYRRTRCITYTHCRKLN